MIWLNLKTLEIKLANHLLTAQTAFNYLLTFLIIFIMLFYLPRDSSYPFDWWDLTELLLVLLLSIIGLKNIFSTNQKGANPEFFKRFLSLSFVTGLRLIIAVMIIWLAYKVIMFIIPLDFFVHINRAINHPVIQMILTPVMVVIFFYLLTMSFRRINSGKYSA